MKRGRLSSAVLWSTTAVLLLAGSAAAAQLKWCKVEDAAPDGPSLSGPLFSVEVQALSNALHRAARHEHPLSLPLPDGTLREFAVERNHLLPPNLARRFESIRTFSGRSTDHNARVQCDWTPSGFHAQVLCEQGVAYVDPVPGTRGELYRAYWSSTVQRPAPARSHCLVETPAHAHHETASPGEADPPGDNVRFALLRTFRIAVAAQGEFTRFHGGTVEAALGAIATTMNRINGIYERDLGVRLQLVADNDQIIYTDPETDPYTFNDASLTTINQNQTNLDLVLGSSAYDLGIVLNTGNYGLAYLRSVCNDTVKGRACIGSPTPIGDAYYVGFVGHEIAHQFGANHTFNSRQGLCAWARHPDTAYEPGSGSTAMAYAGLCESDALQSGPDGYFHGASIEEIRQFVNAVRFCGQTAWASNYAPAITLETGFQIPARTPFLLTAEASDLNGDPLTFCWEQLDLGPAASLDEEVTQGPVFRSFPPTNVSWRSFPRLPALLAGETPRDEKLPATNRTLQFRVTVRDGRGGVTWRESQISVHAEAGPFRVLQPAPGAVHSNCLTVVWDPANTDLPPISCMSVRILLSTNGGLDFPVPLATNTPNDGTETVLLPNDLATTVARIKVEAFNNIFFAVNPGGFTIGSPPFPITARLQGEHLALEWHAEPGRSYRVQFKDALENPSWTDEPGDVTASASIASKDVSLAGNQRFYRVMLLP